MRINKLFKWFMPEEYARLTGWVGEKNVESTLTWMNFLGKNGFRLHNVYIPKKDGGYSQIDLLYITKKGVFVIETKNFSGYIFGNENSSHWRVTLYKGKDWMGRKYVKKIKFYNPIWQNKGHIRYLKEYLGYDFQTISIVVFSDRCELKDINFYSTDTAICNYGRLSKVIGDIWEEYPNRYTDEEVEFLYYALKPLTFADETIRHQHIQKINEKIYNFEVCPKCGGEMILRTVKNGSNKGNQFWGCSNYPKCRFTRNL